MHKKERILGALIGAAYGDAFGMPSEMWTPEKIKAKLGYIDCFLPGQEENEISRGFQAGEVTDDTANLLLVIDMLVKGRGKVDAHLFIEMLRRWAGEQEKAKTVIGPSTAAAFQKLEKGVPMELTGRNGTTNGGAMKILPLGLVYGAQGLEVLSRQVKLLCLPTHNTSCAMAGACAVAAAAGLAAEGERSLEGILDYAREGALAGQLQGFPVCGPSVAGRIGLARVIAEQSKSEEKVLEELYDIVGTGLSAAESVPAALGLVSLSRGNPVKCARYAANIGGDTDTIGAMACGICGAYSGAGAFEKKDIELLERVNGISFERVTDRLMEACGL